MMRRSAGLQRSRHTVKQFEQVEPHHADRITEGAKLAEEAEWELVAKNTHGGVGVVVPATVWTIYALVWTILQERERT